MPTSSIHSRGKVSKNRLILPGNLPIYTEERPDLQTFRTHFTLLASETAGRVTPS